MGTLFFSFSDTVFNQFDPKISDDAGIV